MQQIFFVYYVAFVNTHYDYIIKLLWCDRYFFAMRFHVKKLLYVLHVKILFRQL